jgi:hypothetical protein
MVKSTMPELLSDKFLTHMRDTTDPYRYSCRYKLNPIPESARVFHPDGFQVKGLDHRKCDWIGMILDPAGKHKGDGSKHALIVFGWMSNGACYVIDAWAERCSDPALYDQVAQFVVQYQPRFFGIEQNNFVSHLETNLRQRLEEIAPLVDALPKMEGLTTGGKRKTERIRAMLTDFNRKRCYFNPDAIALQMLMDQILSVTELTPDDAPDLDLADVFGYIDQLSKGRRPAIARSLAPEHRLTEGERELLEALEGVDDSRAPPLYSSTGEKSWMGR